MRDQSVNSSPEVSYPAVVVNTIQQTRVSKTATVAVLSSSSPAERTQSTRASNQPSSHPKEQGPRSSTATPGSAHETGLHSMWRSSAASLALCPATAATGMFSRRHTIRGNRRRTRRTLCAMRSAPRNGAATRFALGSLSHRPLEALQRGSTGFQRRFCAWSVDGVALASVAGYAWFGLFQFIRAGSGHDGGVT
jgi:hypothetical protein